MSTTQEQYYNGYTHYHRKIFIAVTNGNQGWHDSFAYWTKIHIRVRKDSFARVIIECLYNIVSRYDMMSTKDTEKDLESVQKNQKKIGKAGSDPETSGPAEELREKAAEMTDESEDSKEPA